MKPPWNKYCMTPPLCLLRFISALLELISSRLAKKKYKIHQSLGSQRQTSDVLNLGMSCFKWGTAPKSPLCFSCRIKRFISSPPWVRKASVRTKKPSVHPFLHPIQHRFIWKYSESHYKYCYMGISTDFYISSASLSILITYLPHPTFYFYYFFPLIFNSFLPSSSEMCCQIYKASGHGA